MKSIEELFSLKGRVAIVTGASRGLGKEAAEGLAEAGANIVLAARREQWLGPAAEEFRKRGFECLACTCDIAEDDQVRALVSKTLEHFGRIDILVNNAGISWGAPYEEMLVDVWHKVLNTNVIGTQLMTRAVLPSMRKQGYGKIINVASVMGLVGVPKDILEASSYTASKGAVLALTRELAVNYAADGIRVNAVAPGFFPTRLSAAVIERAEERIKQVTPLGRLGQDGELKGAILFLAAPASDYITGQTIAIDGGMTAG
jgi:NAD(P)-dependent dehydrogenase (short-subunit alcohol dehydrogenase family)